MGDEFWDNVKLAVMAFILFIVLLLVLNVLGVPIGRWFGIQQEETRREIYETSRSYNQGMAVDLDSLCREMHTNPDAQAKAALADTIRLRSARFTGELPEHVQTCLKEVR
jgi:hypothetical protein